jgi:hypothetical protein
MEHLRRPRLLDESGNPFNTRVEGVLAYDSHKSIDIPQGMHHERPARAARVQSKCREPGYVANFDF